MSKEVADKTVEFIRKLVGHNPFRLVHINWYGGEPLLGLDVMQRIVLGIRHFHPYVVTKLDTNGWRLTHENAEILKRDCNVYVVQLTLDGSEQYHDELRHRPGSFKKTIEALKVASKWFPDRTILRVNLTKLNVEEAKKIPECLEREGIDTSKLGVDIHPVDIFCDAPFKQYIFETREEFWDEARSVYLLFAQKGFKPRPTMLYGCHATLKDGFSVFPNGEVWKCVLDSESYLGNILEYEKIRLDDSSYCKSKILFEECRNCSAFPVCRGGCLYARKLMGWFCHVDPIALDELAYLVKKTYKTKRR